MEIQVIPKTIRSMLHSYGLIIVNGIFVVLLFIPYQLYDSFKYQILELIQNLVCVCIALKNTSTVACTWILSQFILHYFVNFQPFPSAFGLLVRNCVQNVLSLSLSHNCTFYRMVVCMLQVLFESHNCTKAVRYGERGGHCCSHIVMLSRHE
jgi:hypothetical protein